MIPHELRLTNFLSYRQTAVIDLRGVQLACISGLNGAGKSSILDAITWALFGKCRVVSDDNLVNRAAPPGEAAEVVFIFELEGAIYRVIRRKAIGKTTTLELHVRGDEGEGEARWRVLTESKLRETEAAIEALLRMNYDLFTNASFLLQNKVDEFASTGATRRKQILAEVLGVDRWNEYKERATERRKETERQAAVANAQLLDVEAELAEEPERRRALELAEARLAALQTQAQAQEALVQTLRQNRALIEQQRQQVARVATDLTGAEEELQRVERAVSQRRAQLEEYRAVLDRRPAVEAAFAAYNAAETALAGWAERAEQHHRLRGEMAPLERVIAAAAARLEQQQQELEARQARAAAAAAEQAALADKLAAGQARLARLARQMDEAAQQEQAWREARETLHEAHTNRRLWEQEYATLEARAGDIARWEAEQVQLQRSYDLDRAALEAAVADLRAIADQRQQLADKRAEQAALKSEQERLREEMDDRKARIAQLEAETGQDCPLCGQPLSEQHRVQAISQLEAEGKQQGDKHRRNRPQLDVLDKEIAALEAALKRQPTLERERDRKQSIVAKAEAYLNSIEASLQAWKDGAERTRLAELNARLANKAELDELEARVEASKSAAESARQVTREYQIVQAQVSKDEARCGELERTATEWEQTHRPALEETRRRLAEEAFAEEERAALAVVNARLAAVAYDAAAHTAARARLSELASAPVDHRTLLQAESAVKPLSDTLEESLRQREALTGRVADLRARREEGRRALEALQAGGGDLREAEAEMARLRDEVSHASQSMGAMRQRVDILDKQRQERERLQAEKTALAGRVARLKELEVACGTNGVQALLIDLALPEIEEHANELLYRLSGGEMRVTFATQRKRKGNDDLIETLDIKIADGAGERPYENYSGGEQFRVNFAIRLALSQVLARRAGARLRTLVIDEGFGSQDPEGRQRLVEAINTVQSEFACILVITHIDELRDKFPARVEVEKTAAGSQASVVAV
ncbi:AAA family ATPase [Promineifilum sp.]|uniref:AAA family ATPase n=1 Tax=Promineifilum sp. TaxID=2664178 RepID=UPI0035B1ED6A